LTTLLSTALSLTLTAQTPAPSAPAATQPIPGAYHTFACIKIKPGKDAELRDWIQGDAHKFAQSRVDSGKIYGFVVLRAVLPQGTDAKCDYGMVTFFRGLPSPALTPDEMTAALQKAGVSMTAKEFMDRRESLASLVYSQMLLTHAMVGKGTKGGYVVLNSMSATNVDDWVAFETKVWQPYAEALVKDGMSSGWALNLPLFPDGSKDYIVASTVDMYPTLESVFKRDSGMADRWKKVHPDMDPQATMERANKLRTIEHRSLYRVEDEIMAAQ
jgi:hypothetical protein